jgi:hypothetical protein
VGAPARSLASNDPFLNGEPFANYDGPYTGSTFCLDVQAAMSNPNRDVAGQNYWTHVADIADAEDLNRVSSDVPRSVFRSLPNTAHRRLLPTG